MGNEHLPGTMAEYSTGSDLSICPSLLEGSLYAQYPMRFPSFEHHTC